MGGKGTVLVSGSRCDHRSQAHGFFLSMNITKKQAKHYDVGTIVIPTACARKLSLEKLTTEYPRALRQKLAELQFQLELPEPTFKVRRRQ